MSILNIQAVEDSRKALSGKDGALYNGNGKLLARMETFSTKASVASQSYQPIGEFQEHAVVTGYKITISFTEYVIEDEEFISDLFEMFENGTIPEWNFQGVVHGRNGSEERMVYNYCVPDGDIDLQNVSIGELIKRAWSMTVNDKPRLQGRLSQ